MVPWADELSKTRLRNPCPTPPHPTPQNTRLGQGLPAQLKHSQMRAQSSRDSLWGLPCACDSSSLRNTQQPIVTMSPGLGAGCLPLCRQDYMLHIVGAQLFFVGLRFGVHNFKIELVSPLKCFS